MNLTPLAVNLRALRKARGMTQAGLAVASGVIQPTISSIERGYRGGPEQAIEMLAAALGADVSALRSPKSCGNCAGRGLPGYTCNTCGTAGRPADRSVAA
jgi:transcriptional regulator with XRE-family HTH domain